jgi:hypothetical protein
MIDQIENPLREALRQHASQIPDAAIARLRSVEYHPRSARWRTPVGVGAGAGAAATAATVLLLGGSQPAFAGWSATPTPTAASSSQVSAAQAACQAHLAAAPPAGALTPITATGQGMAPVLTDVRGPYTVAIYADGSSSSMTCFTGPSFTVVSNRSSTGQGTSVGGSVSVAGGSGGIASAGKSNATSFSEGKSVAVGTAPADQLQVYGAHLTLPNGSAYTLIEGQAGSDVTGATLVLDNGQRVEARTQGGWFEGWWPGTATAVTAEVTTTGGTVTEQLPAWTMPPAPPGGSGDSPGSAVKGEA